jgi:hypothetical protein
MSRTLSTASEDVLKGRQLTEQYHRATGGMREVLIFGAMMLQLRREHPELAQRGGDRRSKSNVDFDQKMTLRGWLELHAPEVKYATAQRFLAVTESVACEYPAIVGPKVARSIDLATLVTTPAKKLDDRLAAKQLELFEWVNGTSQRSWLDRFSPQRHTPPKATKASAAKRKANANDETLMQQQLMELSEEHITQIEDIATAGAFKALDTDRLAAFENAVDGLKAVIAAELKMRRTK